MEQPTAKPDGGQPAEEASASHPAAPHGATAGIERRSNEFWLALASIAVTLVVGTVAVGSGWYSAHRHDEQQATRLQVSSTRSQQQDAFIAFINAASDLAVAIQLQVKSIENQYPYFPHSPIPGDRADFETRFTELGHALDSAQLLGNSGVRDQSNKVFNAAAQSRSVIIGWGATHPADNPNSATCPELLAFEDKTESDRQQLANAIDHFSDAAREDLGIPPLPSTSTPPEPLLPKEACANYPH